MEESSSIFGGMKLFLSVCRLSRSPVDMSSCLSTKYFLLWHLSGMRICWRDFVQRDNVSGDDRTLHLHLAQICPIASYSNPPTPTSVSSPQPPPPTPFILITSSRATCRASLRRACSLGALLVPPPLRPGQCFHLMLPPLCKPQINHPPAVRKHRLHLQTQ